MVARIARIHHQPANFAGFARALAGWTITLLGLALLGNQIIQSLGASAWREALAGGGMAALATTLGALPVVFMQRISTRVQDTLLGFGAGVMLAAAVFSLLLPAFDAAESLGTPPSGAAVVVAAGIAIGASLLLVMDRMLPHTHQPGASRTSAAVWLFVFAIAVHNIPEGLAIGVAANGNGTGNAVATGISLQNVPEGLIVAIALASAGHKRLFAFAVAAFSGLIEPLAALAGSSLVGLSTTILPWGLAGAAGAMLFVVSHEIIPESHRRGHETLATAGLIGGFVAMMLMDAML